MFVMKRLHYLHRPILVCVIDRFIQDNDNAKNKHRDESLFSSLCLFLRCHCHCIQTNLNAHMFQKLIINSKRACLLYYIHLNMSTIHKPHSPHESLRDDFYPDRKIYLLFQNKIWLTLRICINVTEIDAKGI